VVPLYEYECTKCQHRFERIQRFSDPPVSECPLCSGAVFQLLSAPAIQFKGSGWYVTDYAGKSPASNGSNGSNGGAKAAETKAETKSEAKADSKAETKPAPAAKAD
jgi:putative FmdB family regulatory protein